MLLQPYPPTFLFAVVRLNPPLDSQPSRRGGKMKIQNWAVNQAEKENNRETNL